MSVNKNKEIKATEAKAIPPLPRHLAIAALSDDYVWRSAYKKHKASLVLRAVLLAFRRAHLLSIEEAADKLGVSRSSLSDWETGKRAIQWHSLRKLAASGYFTAEHLNTEVDL